MLLVRNTCGGRGREYHFLFGGMVVGDLFARRGGGNSIRNDSTCDPLYSVFLPCHDGRHGGCIARARKNLISYRDRYHRIVWTSYSLDPHCFCTLPFSRGIIFVLPTVMARHLFGNVCLLAICHQKISKNTCVVEKGKSNEQVYIVF